MIGIICAMDEELEEVLKLMKNILNDIIFINIKVIKKR